MIVPICSTDLRILPFDYFFNSLQLSFYIEYVWGHLRYHWNRIFLIPPLQYLHFPKLHLQQLDDVYRKFAVKLLPGTHGHCSLHCHFFSNIRMFYTFVIYMGNKQEMKNMELKNVRNNCLLLYLTLYIYWFVS